MDSTDSFSGEQRLLIETVFNETAAPDASGMPNLDFMLGLARMNGVLFRFVTALKKGTTSEPVLERIRTLHDQQAHEHRVMARVTREITDLFEANGLRLIPMKTFLRFPYVDEDLDVITVDQDRVPDYRRLLTANGYGYLKSRSKLREPKKRFYLPRGGHRQGLRIHLHFAVSWNGVDFMDIRKVWDRRRETVSAGFRLPIPSVEDEILIMAAHAVHENRYVLLAELLQLQRLTQNGPLDWDYMIGAARGHRWLPALYFFLLLANRIMERLDQVPPIPGTAMARLGRESPLAGIIERDVAAWDQASLRLSFPVTPPFWLTSALFAHKFIYDLGRKKPRELVRELAAFSVVDWLVYWRFFKDLDKLYALKEQP